MKYNDASIAQKTRKCTVIKTELPEPTLTFQAYVTYLVPSSLDWALYWTGLLREKDGNLVEDMGNACVFIPLGEDDHH